MSWRNSGAKCRRSSHRHRPWPDLPSSMLWESSAVWYRQRTMPLMPHIMHEDARRPRPTTRISSAETDRRGYVGGRDRTKGERQATADRGDEADVARARVALPGRARWAVGAPVTHAEPPWSCQRRTPADRAG